MGKVIKYSPDDWIKRISEDLDKDYQIALHQIGVFGSDESKKAVRKNNPLTHIRKIRPKDYCESIMKTGLLNRWNDISQTVYKFGSIGDINSSILRKESFLNYEYDRDLESSNKELYDVVVAIPSKVQVNGKIYNLGHLAHPGDIDAKPEMSMGTRLFKGSNIPKEFIYGYVHKLDGIVEFTANPQHINMQNIEEQEEFYKSFIKEKQLLTIEEEIKKKPMNEEKDNKIKKGPAEVCKNFEIKKLEQILSLIEEKEKLEGPSTSIIPYKKFNFLQKYLFKRKEYKNYINDRKNTIREQNERKVIDKKRIAEIDKILLKEGFPTSVSIKQKIESLKRAETFDELGIEEPNLEIQALIENGINPEFESLEQAFQIAPEYFSTNLEFMKKAVKKDLQFIIYDKTNDEELYKQYIEDIIEKDEELKTRGELSTFELIGVESELQSFKKYDEELKSPKKAEDGKYKIPHKYMFEEIRDNAIKEADKKKYWYSEIDGAYDIEFGQELEKLYESPDVLLGIHGLNENEDIEKNIFMQGLKNSMQNADNALNRTVAFGKDLTFTKVLNYRIPYNGLETDTAIILTLPKGIFDKNHPIPIWGSNEERGSNNYILPQYIYGLYHSKTDGAKRRIIKNNGNERMTYKYCKYDYNSSRANQFEINTREGEEK